MESIKELRQICQATRPAIFSDFLSKFYYKVAIYFTWICLFLKMSANQVTVLSGAVAFCGGLLLGAESLTLVFVGTLFFHLFAILDMSDGEVARYRKEGGVAGHYLDWYMHFISSTSFMLGLFIASFSYLSQTWLLVLGLVAVVIPILDKCIQNAGWTVICWTRLRDQKNQTPGPCGEQTAESSFIVKTPPKWLRRVRFLFLAPLQDHWAPLIFLFLVLLHMFAMMFHCPVPHYRLLWLLYVGVVGPIHLFFKIRHMVKSSALKDGYRRLICPTSPIKLPQDDFLG